MENEERGFRRFALAPFFARAIPSFALCSTETLATQATLRPENGPIIPQSCSLETEEMIESRTLLSQMYSCILLSSYENGQKLWGEIKSTRRWRDWLKTNGQNWELCGWACYTVSKDEKFENLGYKFYRVTATLVGCMMFSSENILKQDTSAAYMQNSLYVRRYYEYHRTVERTTPTFLRTRTHFFVLLWVDSKRR